MKKTLLNLKFITLLLVVLTTGTMAMGQKVAQADGLWNAPGTWVGGVPPTAGETVTINNGVDLTINVANAVCAGITFQTGATASTIVINTGNSLEVNGIIAMGSGTDNNSERIITLGGGSLECDGLTMGNPSGGDDGARVAVNSGGNFIVNGNITMPGSATENILDINTGGRIKVSGNITGGAVTPDVGTTFEYSGASAQIIGDYLYHNLTISGAGEKTLASAIDIDGHLAVAFGSILTLGNSGLDLNPSGVVANPNATINGRLNINGTGRLTETNGGIKTLILGSGGYLSLTGGTTTVPTLNAYSFHAGSTVDFGAGGNQTIENNPIAITYGNIVTSGTGIKTLETSGGSMTFAGSMTIGSGTTLDANDKTVNVGGNFTNNGTFTQTNTTVVFNGAAVQTIGGSTAQTFNNLTVNGAGLSLNTAATVSGVLALTNGVVNATAVNLTLGGTYSGGTTSASYVNGTLVKTGAPAGAFVFPVGNTANGIRPITVTASAAGSTFSARSFSGNAVVAFPGSITAPLQQVSNCEYWSVARPSGAATATVTMSWSNAICGGSNYVGDMGTLLLARYDGANWVSQGQLGTSGTAANGTLTGNAGAFGTFALGTSNAALNPLPVTFNNVRAFEKNTGVQIEWSNMTEKDVIDYIVERSTNGQTYSAINTQGARSNGDVREDYNSYDASPVNGVNYYRIKVRETTGKVVYSKVLKVEVGGKAGAFTVYPNPVVGGQMTVGLSGVKGKYSLQVVNAGGQVIHTQSINHAGGNMSQQVELPGSVKAGVYSLVISGDNYRQAKMFVVN